MTQTSVTQRADVTQPETTDLPLGGAVPDLTRSVRDVVGVFPVLREQLAGAMDQVETAVVHVCGDFQRISDASRASVARALEAVGAPDDGAGGVGRFGDAARNTIELLLLRIEQTHHRLIETAGKIEAVEVGMRRIEEIVRKVNGIAMSIKMLSLNARIEAARAGDAGRAFVVVASETGKVATDAADMNGAIQAVTQQLSREVRGIAGDIRVWVSNDQAGMDTARGEVGAVLGTLERQYDQVRGTVREAARGADDVASAIGRAVIGLQFQDAVRQRVGNVMTNLKQIEAELAQTLGDGPPAGVAPAWQTRLREGYTMAAEHAVLSGQDQPARGPGDVELF